MRLVSFLPMLNWFALVYLGLKCRGPITFICGIVYGVISYTLYDYAPFLWIIAMVQYAIMHALCSETAAPKKVK